MRTSLLALAAALLGCAYGYSGTPLMARTRMASPVAGVRPALRPAKAATVARFSSPVLQEAAEAAPAAAAACIEDEAIEECTLAEWPAGKISVRPNPREGATCVLCFPIPPKCGLRRAHKGLRATIADAPEVVRHGQARLALHLLVLPERHVRAAHPT